MGAGLPEWILKPPAAAARLALGGCFPAPLLLPPGTVRPAHLVRFPSRGSASSESVSLRQAFGRRPQLPCLVFYFPGFGGHSTDARSSFYSH